MLTAWLSPATCVYDRDITHSRYDALLVRVACIAWYGIASLLVVLFPDKIKINHFFKINLNYL